MSSILIERRPTFSELKGLAKFCGVSKPTFYLHLKETEFRFNDRSQNLYQALLNFLSKAPL